MSEYRTCKVCKAAENPLGRLRFKRSRLDGEIYCENCEPVTHSVDTVRDESAEPTELPRLSPFTSKASAGFSVIACPDCAGGVHRPHGKPCTGCSGYGSVRIQTSMLNVYRPPRIRAVEVLTED